MENFESFLVLPFLFAIVLLGIRSSMRYRRYYNSSKSEFGKMDTSLPKSFDPASDSNQRILLKEEWRQANKLRNIVIIFGVAFFVILKLVNYIMLLQN